MPKDRNLCNLRNMVSSVFIISSLMLVSVNGFGSETHFNITVNADNQQYSGNMTLAKEVLEHNLTMSFRSSFDKKLPERIIIPGLEEVQKGGGLTISRTEPPLKSEQGEALIRISEYGSYDDLERKLIELSYQSEGKELKGDKREYRSAFLMMNEPSSIAHSKVSKLSDGYTVALTMSNGSELLFGLNTERTITSFDIFRDDYSLRYAIADTGIESINQ